MNYEQNNKTSKLQVIIFFLLVGASDVAKKEK